MAVSRLAALAAGATPAVYVIAGDGGRARARRLRFDGRVHAVASPREATVLVVVGELVDDLEAPARRVHDQIPDPRGVVAWAADDATAATMAATTVVSVDDDPVPAIIELHRALVTGRFPSSVRFGPERNPQPWQGVGPHGQGGKGMMGGKPYGRAMAMTGPDVRDGLELDRVCLSLGPFLCWMPHGLRLDVIVQGDVIQQLDVHTLAVSRPDLPGVFVRAATEEVELAELERARARHLLEVTAELLGLHGLSALAVRTMAVAAQTDVIDGDAVRRLHRWLRATGALAMRGVGRLRSEHVARLGPVARASGVDEDARRSDPAYGTLGFSPVVGHEADARARLQQRLAEAAQALDLAAAADKQSRAPGPILELPRGSLVGGGVDAWPDRLAEIGVGMPFDAFVTTLVSLDLDVASKAFAEAQA